MVGVVVAKNVEKERAAFTNRPLPFNVGIAQNRVVLADTAVEVVDVFVRQGDAREPRFARAVFSAKPSTEPFEDKLVSNASTPIASL